MKTLYTTYNNFAKRLVMSLMVLMTVGVGTMLGDNVTLSSSTITNGKKLAYTTEWTYTANNVTWSGYCYTDANSRPWLQLKKDLGVYIKISTPDNTKITKFETTITSATNSSGGIEDITKHTDFSGRIALLTSDATGSTSMTGVAYTTSVSNDIATLSPSGENNVLYLKVSAGARIWSMTVTYESLAPACTYTVTFNGNGNTGGSMSAQEFNCGESKALKENAFTKTGHTFAGWNTKQDGTGSTYSNQQSVNLSSTNNDNIPLYAQWTPNKYTVNFTASPNGYGTVSQSKIDNVPYGTVVTSNSNTITINGTTVTANPAEKDANYSYSFNNWSNIPNTITGTCTITADFTRTERALTNYRTTCSSKENPNLSWSANSCVATMEVDNEIPTLTNPYDLLVKFSSSDPTVATIDENGNITLLKAGTTVITATYEEDEDYLPASVSYTLTVKPSNCKWIETDITNINSGDKVVVTMTTAGGVTYALPSEQSTGSNPKAMSVRVVDGKTLEAVPTTIVWIINKEGDNLTFESLNYAGYFLDCTNTDAGVRVSNGNNRNRNFVIDPTSGYLKNTQTTDARYLGVHNTNSYWYCYTTYGNNTGGQTLKFYKKECLDSDEFRITYNLTGVTCTNPTNKLSNNSEDIELNFTANAGYQLPENITVLMGGEELDPNDNQVYIWEDGTILIDPSKVTGDIIITIEGCELLALPTNLKATNITSSSARLTWDEIEHAEQYQVHVTDDDDSTEDIITTTSSTYFEITGLKSASPYLWGVTPIATGYCGITQEAEYFETLDVYNVTFNSNGGTAVEPQTVDAGSKITAPANPSAAGYTFNYWYTTDANVPFDFNTPITGNTTLNAKWTPNVYTITFYKQSGDGGTANATVTFNSNNYSVSTIEAPTREKYAFGGYYTEQHGAGVQVVDAEGNWVKNVAGYTDANGNWIKAADTHLYAKWTAIYTITWVVNNNTETPYHTSTVLSGSTIDQLPTPPANNLFADCDVNAFVGWSTDNIGFDPDPTAPTDLFKTEAEAQNKIGAISADKKFYAVYATTTNTTVAFDASDVSGLTNNNLTWTDETSGISLTLSAGQRYTNGTPNTFTVTQGSSNYCQITAPSEMLMSKVVVELSGSNYKVNSVSSGWSLSTSSTTQTITGSGADLKMSATSSYQIRIKTAEVTYTTYSNFITRCTALPDPVWGGATIDNAIIPVNCGSTTSNSHAAQISFPAASNYKLYKDITIEASSGFVLSTSRDAVEYQTSVTLSPTQSGTNAGTFANKYVYVRAVAPAMSDEDFTGTITISGQQIATQTITVTAEVSCTQYTLTFNDQGQTKTVEGFAGTTVEAPEPWAGICTEPIQYVFDGWAETPVANDTEEYEKIDFSAYTMPDNNTTVLYAVYRYAEEGGEPVNGYVKVTEALSDWTGDYVIVNETAKKAIGNEYAYTNTLTAVDVEITDNHQVQSPTNNIIWQIRKHGEYYTMYNESARKYAYVDRDKTEGAGLSSTITGTTQDVQIIFNSGTAKVSGVGYYRCFYYNSDKIEWRTYATGSYNTGALYRLFEKTLRYTSSLVCGEISVEEDNVVVTSTKDQKVKVNVPIKVSSYYNDVVNVTGVGESTFSVAAIENVAVNTDETVNLELTYSPSEYDHLDNETITLTASNGATTTFQVKGRSLPEKFAVVAKVGNNWFALPSQGLNSETTPIGYPIAVDNNEEPTEVTSLPTTAEWSLRNVHKVNGSTDRFARNGENLVFINAENKTLYANTSNANIQTYANYSNYAETHPERYEWVPTTEDLTTYTLKNVGRDKNLSINVNTTFGTHTTNIATSNLRFLPIETTYTPIDMKVVEWYPTKVLVQTETTLASVSVMVGNEVVSNPIVTPVDAKLYEISGLPLKENPTKLLTIKYGELACNKVIPIILSQEEITVADALFSTLTTSVYNYSDLVVRDGAKLTINGIEKTPDKFVNVTIYPTAKIVVPENTQLNVYSLTFIGGITEVYDGSNYTLNKYAVPELSLKGNLGKTVTTMDYVMRVNLDQMYSLALPYDVALDDITYGDGSAIELGSQLYVSAYDGAARAQNLGANNNWVYEIDFATKFGSATLKAGVGYTISAQPQTSGDNYAILRLPMKSNIASGNTEAAKSVAVTAHGADAAIADNHKGWNLVANPYMASISGDSDEYSELMLRYMEMLPGGTWQWTGEEQRYVTIPYNDGSGYYQLKFSEAVLQPFKNFFVQVGTTGDLDFVLAHRQNAPARYMQTNTEREVEFEIILGNSLHQDNAGMLISDKYTPAYEINADLEKMTGSMSLYTIYNGYKLAYNATSLNEAEEWIPVGYIVPKVGEYTFKLDERAAVEDIIHIYLMDNETGVITDLIDNTYTFETSVKKNENRFAISVVLSQEESGTTTGVDDLLQQDKQAQKFIYNDQLFILRDGVVYDAMGQRITTINK